MTNYQKYTWVCTGDCDALIEYTIKDGYGWPAGVMDLTCRCNSNCTLLSVEDATIPYTDSPLPTKEDKMETTTPQVMTLDWIENDVVTNKTYTESDVRHMVWQLKNLTTKQNEWFKKESQLRTFIHDNFEDSEDQESLTAIAEMFDIPLTKEIEYTAWVRVDMTIEVEIGGDMDAIEDFISSNLTVDSYDSMIQVNSHEIDRVEEGAY